MIEVEFGEFMIENRVRKGPNRRNRVSRAHDPCPTL